MAAEFSLNTQMYLLSKKSLWLSDGSMGFGQESDVAFAEGITLHVRRLLICLPLCLSSFIEIVFEGNNYNLLYGLEIITGSLSFWQGGVTEIGYMLQDGFYSGEVNLYFPYLNDF